jgi:hypothetical protein
MVKGGGWFRPRRNDHEADGSRFSGGDGNGGRRFFRTTQKPPRLPPVPCLERRIYVEAETARQFAEAIVPLPWPEVTCQRIGT